MRARPVDLVAQALVLGPAAALAVWGLDLGGLRPPMTHAVTSAAHAVAQPVADELLERLPWPGVTGTRGSADVRCVFGPYRDGHPCVAAPGSAGPSRPPGPDP